MSINDETVKIKIKQFIFFNCFKGEYQSFLPPHSLILCGRRGNLMVSVLDSRSSGPGSIPGWDIYCVEFLGKTLSQCLSSPRCTNEYRRIVC